MSAEIKDGGLPAEDLVSIEVDGTSMNVAKGSMIIEATDKAGISIPRFCYHRKLSIAANCRMCLVDVEKSPKPMPACATPVMDGMKIYTQSRRAVDAQHGVMEFLLINHPLDCPICDQGGECELQDLAMGYGRSVSRFVEKKRVVKDKNVGALIQTDMTRCIHCTRCIRFLEEIAGTTEMGGSGRGDQLEIGTCVENSIDSELSGNIIDLCPVGALTNKPFRFAARAWELVARPSVATHDGIGSLVYHHTRRGRILRSVPRDCEATNETWLSDRDRYSQSGLYTEDRATQPQLKKDGQWQEVSWDEAIRAAAEILNSEREGAAENLFALMSPSAATEEYFLAQRLVRSLGSSHIDHRLREQDFSDDGNRPLAPVFQMPLAEIENADSVLLLGCNPRHEAPILGHRLRKAWQKGAALSAINPLDWEFVFDTTNSIIVGPQFMLSEIAAVAASLAAITRSEMPAFLVNLVESASGEERHENIAKSLLAAKNGLLILGQFAMSHHQAAAMREMAAWIARTSDIQLNLLPHGANSTGAWQAGAVPHRGPGGQPDFAGQNRVEMTDSADKTWVLWNIEPEYDIENPHAAIAALKSANQVIAITSYETESLKQFANIILPLAPLAESEGSLVNLNGDVVEFSPAGKAQGDAKPGWKILRRLGAALELDGFAQVSLNQVQTEMRSEFETSNSPAERPSADPELQVIEAGNDLYRIGEVPMYSSDAVCRRADALQQSVHAFSQFVGLNPVDATRLGLSDGGTARVHQGEAYTELEVRVRDQVPVGGAWVRSGTCSTRELGSATGPIKVEVA
jgi:NADH-quinone oxidoreductase subunit G